MAQSSASADNSGHSWGDNLSGNGGKNSTIAIVAVIAGFVLFAFLMFRQPKGKR